MVTGIAVCPPSPRPNFHHGGIWDMIFFADNFLGYFMPNDEVRVSPYS